ncbi:SWIM zinc finger family protein [Kineosporia sp. NBRC 101731]|uniref:SWIM zinc finger family protein n=1 Tax=Kineosporia sp. NBRC 101731 TaxID=3032199 RepID=UPI0024A05454|nr:SWIM zinc finger family protein [Kineosporia sp. NBRC 101731]GLY31468.1 hypothetical protein Kisp02_48330 [Kineosporia sp. NBRC 101731]
MQALATYSYRGPSELTGLSGLRLQTSGGPAANPRFFSGDVTVPGAAAAGLLVVSAVAAADFRRTRTQMMLDPVVTAEESKLRFEAFSGCTGVHVRLDLLPEALDGDGFLRHGTTNIDINAPLRRALARVRDGRLHLDVGPDDVAVTTATERVVERKVPLPASWLRGFTETQVIASGFDVRAEVDRLSAAAFLARLPGKATRDTLWVVPAGRGLRLTARPVAGAVGLGGAQRLSLLTPFLRHAKTLRVYGAAPGSGPSQATGSWELSGPGLRLTLTLSPQASRGFAGEGAGLIHLSGSQAEADADLVSTLLAWDTAIDVAGLAQSSGLTTERVRAALTVLATAGRVGYDVAEAAYFHRSLPQGPGVEQLNPRLRRARWLVAEGAVTVTDRGTEVLGSQGRVHLVRTAGATASCTCTWWEEHRGDRGPCAHVLAAGLLSGAVPDEAGAGVAGVAGVAGQEAMA